MKKNLNESVLYPENLGSRMHRDIEEDIKNQKHSLGDHPSFPESDEYSFEEKIMGERFNEVCKRLKRVFGVDSISPAIMADTLNVFSETIGAEHDHISELEKLAVEIVKKEFDIDDDIIEFKAELTSEISLKNKITNYGPSIVKDIQFESHDEIVNANKEVYKRRLINALIQGSAVKCNHMFHMHDDELADINPKLPSLYSKLMALADYGYYIISKKNEKNLFFGGAVNVEFPKDENSKPIIHAQAMCFPVLIHELIKGVMELIAAHGLPEDETTRKYVLNKADFLAAEPWDIRIGPAIWSRFTNVIDAEDFDLKHQVFMELVKLPPDEFNAVMKEIFANTKSGNKIVKNIVDEVRKEMQYDAYKDSMDESDDVEEFL